MTKNIIGWFDLPVADMERAKKFYGKLLGVTFTDMGNTPEGGKYAYINTDREAVSGGLHENPSGVSDKGVLIYFNTGGNLKQFTENVKACGGKIVMDCMSLGEHGFMTTFKDSEGNLVAGHSMKL